MIEDETFTRAQLSAHFAKGGYTVYAKPDADGVADFVKRKGIDLVLLDINLPGKDGVTLARELPAGDAPDEENILHFERSLDNFFRLSKTINQ
jgi:DNA-binding response OmpR family regulator